MLLPDPGDWWFSACKKRQSPKQKRNFGFCQAAILEKTAVAHIYPHFGFSDRVFSPAGV
jgi:hypothetical protein